MFLRSTSLPSSIVLFLIAAPLAAQAHLVADLAPGIASSNVGVTNALAVLGERAIFSAGDGTTNSLYSSDGTAAGTTAFLTLSVAPASSYMTELVTMGGRVYFPFGVVGTGTELWVTDGTAAGTGLVKDIKPGPLGSSPNGLAAIDGVLYFSAAAAGGNYELWRSDGTAVGTWLVKEIHSSPTVGSSPYGFARLGSTGRFLFAAADATTARELWASDGTAAGTMLVKDIVPGGGGGGSSTPLYLTSFGERVAFTALGSLWLSDGTEAGTVAVAAGSGGHLAAQGGKIYFTSYDLAHGAELWASDGTSVGTALVADINPGASGSTPFGSYPYMKTTVGSRWIYFAATTNTSGTELWRTDGTLTELFTDIRPGTASGNPCANGYPGTVLADSHFAVTAEGKVFLIANDGISGYELWVADSGVVASSLPFGSGCGTLSLTATTPYLGTTVVLTTSSIPATALLSANTLSFTKYAPPIDLTSIGMPGCFQHCGLDATVILFGSPTATRTLAIPSDPSWLGAEIQSQSYSLVPAINPLGAISSNGVTLVLGDL